LALIGANGCGKSTLLKLLDGLIFPSVGALYAFGSVVTEDLLEDEGFSRAFRSRVGLVFQNADAQVFSATVREEVAFGCLQLGMGREETVDRCSDVLSMLGISGLADRSPFQLSGGEKRRVAIASVLVMNPDVLLLDEPTAGLDPRTQQWLSDLIVELNEHGRTVVFATHDLDLVARTADRCIVLGEEHSIEAVGPPDRVLADDGLLIRANLVLDRAAHRRSAVSSAGG
jgi:cobalt/nickel transport system ATP-binding protein